MTAPPPSILTIGNFDGIHLGHAALIRRAQDLATQASTRPEIIVLAFDPHPATILRPAPPRSEPPRLTTWPHRGRLLKHLGADRIIRLHPSPELLATPPATFVQQLVRDYRPLAIVEGPDFRFGKARAGDMTLLAELGRQHGFKASIVNPVEVRLTDSTLVRASSTLARWLIAHGRMADARIILGRHYELEGIVIQGDRRGRTIGFPTANIKTDCLLPADGVYAGAGTLPDGRELPAAISIGSKPTFGENARALEAYLLTDDATPGAPGAWQPLTGLPEYNWPLRLQIRHWLRDQAKYGSLEALLEQMDRDCRRTLELTTSTPQGTPACR